jgi:RNA 3'-terminal phosphate cyclase
MSAMVHVDGSEGEGGGQVVRTAVALAALTGRACRVTAIRAGRKRPGLAAQHLAGIRGAASLSAGQLEGAERGSGEIVFRPGPLPGSEHHVEVGTAGAISLVLQVLVPIALGSDTPTRLTVTGGTDVAWSPPLDYLEQVHFEWLRRLGADIRLAVKTRGFYPRGGGRVVVRVQPWERLRRAVYSVRAVEKARAGGGAARRRPEPLAIVYRGELEELRVHSLATDDLAGASVAERQIEGFRHALGAGDARANRTAHASRPALPPLAGDASENDASYVRAACTGTVLFAFAAGTGALLGASGLGERGKRAERIGAEVAGELETAAATGAPLDRWMADQIVPYLGLFGGAVRAAEITLHARTNMQVVERFLPVRFSIEGDVIGATPTS